jgi:hypothetical protein
MSAQIRTLGLEQVCYHTHYVVDGGKQRIILGVLVVPGEVMDNQPILDLLWRVSCALARAMQTGDW